MVSDSHHLDIHFRHNTSKSLKREPKHLHPSKSLLGPQLANIFFDGLLKLILAPKSKLHLVNLRSRFRILRLGVLANAFFGDVRQAAV